MSRYKFLGVNDDREHCECCGKQGLKRVVWIEDTETGEIKHYGTTCATNPAKAFGHKVAASIRSASTKFERWTREARNSAWWDIKVLLRSTMFIKGTLDLNEEGKALWEKLTSIHYRMTYMHGHDKDAARKEYQEWYQPAAENRNQEWRLQEAAWHASKTQATA